MMIFRLIEAACCLFSDGVVSYDIPQGERRGLDVDLSDATYDGLVTDAGRRLTGGLGQLTDGELGQSNFRIDRHGARGYEWIGWRRRDDPGDQADFVELSFGFDALRNFSNVSFHANNQFSRDVRVFRAARLTFSGGGRDRSGLRSGTVNYAYLRDDVIEYARIVTVSLQHQVGDHVTVRLYFDAKWILISEVQFESGTEQSHVSISINPLKTNSSNYYTLPSTSNLPF